MIDKSSKLMFLLAYFDVPKDITIGLKALIINGLLESAGGSAFVATQKGKDMLEEIENEIEDSKPVSYNEQSLLALAVRLKEIYPKGKKDNLYYWADSPKLIARRLKIFFAKYGEYDADDIVDATQRYLNDNQNNPYLKLLKYFIFKESKGTGNIEPSSDLLNYLENKEEDGLQDNHWMLDIK